MSLTPPNTSAAARPPATPAPVIDEDTRYRRDVRVTAARMAEGIIHAAIQADPRSIKHPVDIAENLVEMIKIIEKTLYVGPPQVSN
ncbi:MAG: hypothetical protein HC888_16125 [Candidatus Competibacteraceae bacterium]|nr:hypothetical protein [Candidatus Competibacteraceae bacterium]